MAGEGWKEAQINVSLLCTQPSSAYPALSWVRTQPGYLTGVFHISFSELSCSLWLLWGRAPERKAAAILGELF